MRTYLTVKDLKRILKDYDDNLHVVVTRDGNGHAYPVTDKDICISGAYFADQRDYDAIGGGDEDEAKKYLNIGYF